MQFGEVIKERLHNEIIFQQKPKSSAGGSQANTEI